MSREQRLHRRILELLAVVAALLLIPLITSISLMGPVLLVSGGLVVLSTSMFLWNKSYRVQQKFTYRVVSVTVGVLSIIIMLQALNVFTAG